MIESLDLQNSPIEQASHSLSWDRGSVLAFCIILCSINALMPRVFGAIASLGITGAFSSMLGVSAVIWFALYACYKISKESNGNQKTTVTDVCVLGVMVCSAIFPSAFISGCGLLLGSLYFLRSSPQGSNSWRIAIIGLSLTSTIIWGPVLLSVFGAEILAFDAAVVNSLSELRTDNNLIYAVDGETRYLVAGGCSSIANISLTLILMASLMQILKIGLTRRLAFVGIIGIVSMILVNALRLIALGYYPEHFDVLHEGYGRVIFGWLAMLTMAIVIGLGVHDAAKNSN